MKIVTWIFVCIITMFSALFLWHIKLSVPKNDLSVSEIESWKNANIPKLNLLLEDELAIENADRILDGQIQVPKFPLTSWPDDPNWGENPLNHNSWSFEIHSFYPISCLLIAFEKTKDPKYLEKANFLILDWIDGNPVGNSPSSFSWNDHSTGNRALVLSEFWRIYCNSDLFNVQDAQKILDSVKLHGKVLLLDDFHTFAHNHGIFQDKSLITLAIVFHRLKESKKWLNVAVPRIMSDIQSTVSDEGVHLENSLEYQFTMMLLISEICDLFEKGGLEETKILENILQKMAIGDTYFRCPDGTLPAIGDTYYNNKPRNLKVLNPRLTQVIEDNPEYYYALTAGKCGKKPIEVDKCFPLSGFASMRTSWELNEDPSFLFFTFANHSKIHKHQDDLSFEFYDSYGKIFVDPGCYGYTKDKIKEYVTSWDAHNTISIKNDAGVAKSTNLEYWSAKEDVVIIQGRKEMESGNMHKRRLLFIKPNVIVIFDSVKTVQPSQCDLLFHFAPEFQLKQNGKNIFATNGDNFRKVELIQLGDVDSVETIVGRQNPFQGFITSVLDTQSAPVISYRQKKLNPEFVSLITINNEDTLSKVEYVNNGESKIITWEDQKYKYRLNNEEKNVMILMIDKFSNHEIKKIFELSPIDIKQIRTRDNIPATYRTWLLKSISLGVWKIRNKWIVFWIGFIFLLILSEFVFTRIPKKRLTLIFRMIFIIFQLGIFFSVWFNIKHYL